jgi:hypothetical protein
MTRHQRTDHLRRRLCAGLLHRMGCLDQESRADRLSRSGLHTSLHNHARRTVGHRSARARKASSIHRTPVASHMAPSPGSSRRQPWQWACHGTAHLPDLRLQIITAVLDSDHHGPSLGSTGASGHSLLDLFTAMAGHSSMSTRMRCLIRLRDCRIFRQYSLATNRSDRQGHSQRTRRRRSSSDRRQDPTALGFNTARGAGSLRHGMGLRSE